MDFFDDEDDTPERGPRGGDRPAGRHGGFSSAPVSRQQARARQAMLAIGAILLLILIVLAFRGCLDARKSRAFENYVNDLSSIAAESKQLSSGFFDRLEGKGQGSSASGDIGFEAEVNGDKGTAQALLNRARGLDAPDELGAAQTQVVLSFELRHDALEGIAAQLSKLSSGGDAAEKATDAIYTQMRVFSASDILFARARDQIQQALEDQGVTVEGGVPRSRFLPKKPDYLDPAVTAEAVGGAAGGGASENVNCEQEDVTHGTGIIGATLLPSGTELADGGAATAPEGDESIQIAVQNQGEADESGLEVTVSSDGRTSGSGTIDEIAAGETQTVDIPLRPAPGAGETLNLEAEVATVPCEGDDSNNTASYSITF